MQVEEPEELTILDVGAPVDVVVEVGVLIQLKEVLMDVQTPVVVEEVEDLMVVVV
jgi:hypothetical protein